MNLSPQPIQNPSPKIGKTAACCRAARFLLHRRRRGKIANLPNDVREQLNRMLRDGLPYATIIARLGQDGNGLIPQNLSRWRKGDHQDWLAGQRWIAATAGLTQTAQATRDLALLLTELDNEPVSRPADHVARHINLTTKIIDIIYQSCSSRSKETAD
jgi:hypothetical protein